MKRINALQLRQSLSKVIETLQKTGEPVLLEKGRRPAAVLISLDDFRERFSEKDADDRRHQLVEEIRASARSGKKGTPFAEEVVRQLRGQE